jgi:hypothetical protein
MDQATFKNVNKLLTHADIVKAEKFWIRDAQFLIDANSKNLRRLCPKLCDDGIIVVGGRLDKWIQMGYNESEVILLPYGHRFSRLYATQIHEKGHYGVSTTVSKIRARFWIIGLQRMVKSIKFHCVMCRKLDKCLTEQEMGKIPQERWKPSPPWSCTGVDRPFWTF